MGVSSKGTSRSHSPRIEPQNQNNYSYKRQELRDREKNTKEHIQTLPQKPLYKAPQPPQKKNILG